MTRQPMQIEEFLLVMGRNAAIYPEFAALPEQQKRLIAHVNICTGTAESFFDEEGRLFGVGGIRYLGLGEGWFITNPEYRTPALLRLVTENFTRIIHDKNLWRVFAETRISPNFLRHLNFEKNEMYIFTRK